MENKSLIRDVNDAKTTIDVLVTTIEELEEERNDLIKERDGLAEEVADYEKSYKELEDRAQKNEDLLTLYNIDHD